MLSALLAACAGASGGPAVPLASGTATSQRASGSAPAARGGVFSRPVLNPRVFVTARGVYVAWQVSPASSATVRSELARIDPATGGIEAKRRLGADIGQVIAARGSLWVAASSGASRTLLRLEPRSLAVMDRKRLTGSRFQAWGLNALAVAGGMLWVADGNRLLHFSLPNARVRGTVRLGGAASSGVSANAAGTVLVVGEANSGGRGAVQRRDPATGAVLAAHPALGVWRPVVAGPDSGAIWMSLATGMMGYVQRLDATTLAGEGTCPEVQVTDTCVPGSNGISARLANGLLWVTQVDGGTGRNYCAAPSDGRVLAPIRLPQPARDAVLAIARHQIFYAAPGPGATQRLRTTAIPAACRMRRQPEG